MKELNYCRKCSHYKSYYQKSIYGITNTLSGFCYEKHSLVNQNDLCEKYCLNVLPKTVSIERAVGNIESIMVALEEIEKTLKEYAEQFEKAKR